MNKKELINAVFGYFHTTAFFIFEFSLQTSLQLSIDKVYKKVYNNQKEKDEKNTMSKYENILIEAIYGAYYFNNEDLRVNKKYNILLSRQELKEYLNFKDNFSHDLKVELPLKTFNSKKIYFFITNEFSTLLRDYLSFIATDNREEESTLTFSTEEDLIVSQLASEIEGSSLIEGVNSTRKKILEIYKDLNKSLVLEEEKNIRNMKQALEFILEKPKFTKDNLHKLYNILSNELLSEEKELKGKYYRDGMVYIGAYEGCPVDKIDVCLDSLFSYVGKEIKKENFLIPFIAHYYLLYIHPYYDLNGRTARMIFIWTSLLLSEKELMPKYVSEAINEDKSNYYKAINDTRLSCNDLTYFITYLMKLINEYYLIYKNINTIKKDLALIGETLTPTETFYLKRIIINSKKGWFNHRGFINFCRIEITKQGALKILNKFLNLEILKAKTNNRNEKIFILNEKVIKYEF